MIDNRMKAAKKAKDFWYAWHPKDYASKTATLKLVEHGAYRVLLDHYYEMNGSVVANATDLLRVCRAFDEAEQAAVRLVLARYFVERDGYYHHERADIELEKRAKLREKRAEAGSKGGKQKVANAVANATILLDVCQTQSQSQSLKAVATTEPVAIATSKEPQQEPVKSEPTADIVPLRSQSPATKREAITQRLIEALGTTAEMLHRRGGFESFPWVFAEWVAQDCDAEADIWPTISKLAARANELGRRVVTPTYFEKAIFRARDDRIAALPTPAERRKGFDDAMLAWTKADRWWHESLGPRPDEPGCLVPLDILQKYLPEKFGAAS